MKGIERVAMSRNTAYMDAAMAARGSSAPPSNGEGGREGRRRGEGPLANLIACHPGQQRDKRARERSIKGERIRRKKKNKGKKGKMATIKGDFKLEELDGVLAFD